jgi:hypothetical protein
VGQTVSFMVRTPSADAEAQIFLPRGAAFEAYRYERRTYAVETPGPSMGFGSPSASKTWTPPKGTQ